MTNEELVKAINDELDEILFNIKMYGLLLEEIRRNKAPRMVSPIRYLWMKFNPQMFIPILNVNFRKKRLVKLALKSEHPHIRALGKTLLLLAPRGTNYEIQKGVRKEYLAMFKPMKIRIWSIILHAILKIFRIIADVFSDSLPGMMNIKTSGSQRTMNVLQNIAKTGRSVTVDELMWLSRDALFKNASNIMNIKTVIDMKSNIGVPSFVNWGDKITYKATPNAGETVYTIQSRLPPFPSKK